MHVFIDESGPFTGFHKGSISVVGALAIPSARRSFLARKYAKIRAGLPHQNGEVKGRLLNEKQIDKIVQLLSRNEAFFEITALDLGIQSEEEVRAYKTRHGEEMLARVNKFAEEVRPKVKAASQEILDTSLPLYLQALTTFELIHRLLGHMTMYFSQRRPKELGSFNWVVDGKDPKTVTKWERWWSYYAQGAIANMSVSRPAPRLAGADYSFYDASFSTTDEKGEQGTDLSRVLKDIRFSTEAESGLEFVDVLTNAVRRALTGNLRKDGWENICKLMVHRNKESYIQFVLFREGQDVVRQATYGKIVLDGFSSGGKSMLTKRNNRLADEEGT